VEKLSGRQHEVEIMPPRLSQKYAHKVFESKIRPYLLTVQSEGHLRRVEQDALIGLLSTNFEEALGGGKNITEIATRLCNWKSSPEAAEEIKRKIEQYYKIKLD